MWIYVYKTQKKYFQEVSRYGTKDQAFVKKLEEAFIKRKDIPPNIFIQEETIGNYLLRETIGNGTFGTVKLAVCKKNRKKSSY